MGFAFFVSFCFQIYLDQASKGGQPLYFNRLFVVCGFVGSKISTKREAAKLEQLYNCTLNTSSIRSTWEKLTQGKKE